MGGTLYVVGTPIGNLSDMTVRAVDALKSADIVAAEDTRHTKKLLTHFGIRAELTSYHEHNEKEKGAWLVERLKDGKSVALVTDAGTPGISDPGYRLVRLAAEEGVNVVPVPGASALTAALSVAGLPTDEFTFKGFIPSAAAGRKKFFLSIKGKGTTVVAYEAARRLKETLLEMEATLGDVEAVICRELTKTHEEVLRGRAAKIISNVRDRELKGEVTLVFFAPEEKPDREGLAAELRRMLNSGMSVKDAARAAAEGFGLPRGEAYREALKAKEESE